MANKKVIFVDVMDIINIPSQSAEPKNCTDYQLKYEFVKALKESKDLVRVNLLDFNDNLCTVEDIDERMGFIRVLCHWLFVCTNFAATPFSALAYQGAENCLKVALVNTKDTPILGDESNWLFVGSEEKAEKYGIDYISVEDFINGTSTDTEGTETGEEGQEG